MWKSKFAVPAALTLAIALPASALASGEEIDHLKRENAEMKQMLMRMQEQLQEVMMKTNAMEQQVRKAAEGADKKKGGMVKSKQEDITISTTGGGINVQSSMGNEFKIGGRLMYDLDSYDDFWGGEDAEENEIRRSRITLSGKSGKNWSYKFTTDIDHEGRGASVDTGYLKYSSKPMYVVLGKHKRPGMLEERTSTKWISTIERSIINELSGAFLGKPDFGGISVGFATEGDVPMSGAIGIYDDEIEEDDGGDVYGVGARFSIMPKFDDDSFLHAGASFYTVDYKGNTYGMRTRMGVHTAGHPFETDSHASDDIDQFGVELAYVNGPFSLQGEFMNVESDGTDDDACNATATYAPGSDAIPAMEKTVYQMNDDGTPVLDGDGNQVAEMEKYLVMQVATGNPDITTDNPSTPEDETATDQSVMEVEVDLGVSQEDLAGYKVGQSFGALDTSGNDGVPDGNVDAGADGDFIVRERAVTRMTEARAAVDAVFSNEHTSTCDIEMDGFYLQAAYTLTGETRGYKAGSGAFAAIKPKNEGGAWEVVARYEDAEVDIPGRSLTADLERMVLGVNWYVNKNVKFMLNYVDSEVDGCSDTPQTFVGGPVREADRKGFDDATKEGFGIKSIKRCNNDDGQAFSLRGQYVF